MNVILEFSKKNKEDLQESASLFEENNNNNSGNHQLEKNCQKEKDKDSDFVVFNKCKNQK